MRENTGLHGDVPLSGGRMTGGVTRRGHVVRRPMGPWSPAVHELLRHLEAVGFDGAPRVLGTEGDTEVLSFLEGEVASDPEWEPGRGARLPSCARSEEGLAAVGRLLARLHRAVGGFVPSETGYRFRPHPRGREQIVSHGDLGPWNTVYRGDLPVAFIDWDAAGPIEPVTELAAAAWAFLPIARPGQLRESGFDPLPDLASRLRILVDAYGLTDRLAILPALRRTKLEQAGQVADWPIGPADSAVSLEFFAAELRLLEELLPEFQRAL
ncbi:phosphotransferase [Streptosporangium sp. LJ11]|uniref:phosphotransferase n=1 Tax=Streptosporangium sp. LJ11 TaxID=3436927 RepID=UPI003F79C4CE